MGVWTHLRNKLFAGAMAAIPVVVCVYAAVWVESNTRLLAGPLGLRIPGLGLLIALIGIYLLGLLVTSYLGRLFLRLVGWGLSKVPGLNLLIRAWKDVLVVSPEKSGMFHQAVLVPVETDQYQLGFTSGSPLPADSGSICVFLPDLPNPFSGRLILISRSACISLSISVEEALKYQLSSGNYLPAQLSRLQAGPVETHPG